MPHWDSQNPDEYGWRYGELATIVPYTYRQHPFPAGVAKGTELLWTAALDLMCAQPGFQLPDTNPLIGGCWGFEARPKKSGRGRSLHGWGLALDVGAPWNPYGGGYPPPSPYRLPRNTGTLLRPLGILWGGDWAMPDWMHLECHLSPTEVAQLPLFPAPPPAPPAPPAGRPPYPLPAGCYYGPLSGPAQSISGIPDSDRGYRPGLMWAQIRMGITADGRYGAVTAMATRRWQAGHGLSVDGLIGPLTWASLAV